MIIVTCICWLIDAYIVDSEVVWNAINRFTAAKQHPVATVTSQPPSEINSNREATTRHMYESLDAGAMARDSDSYQTGQDYTNLHDYYNFN